jgi:hypothetical protein
MPIQNGGEAGGENALHFLSREGGDRFLNRRPLHFLRQRRTQGQGGGTKQDQ